MAQYFDISPEISESLAVFPGDTPFSQTSALDFRKGDHFALSSIQTTVHIGAHTDAPSHYHAQGETIEQRALHYYIGRCQVISVQCTKGERILPAHIESQSICAKRILFKTSSYLNPYEWHGHFNALSEELINFLAKKEVILVGIDTPSIDLAEDKQLGAHQAVYRHNFAILEGIVLKDVPDGVYTLIALPLKIKGAEASPVRAILCKK